MGIRLKAFERVAALLAQENVVCHTAHASSSARSRNPRPGSFNSIQRRPRRAAFVMLQIGSTWPATVLSAFSDREIPKNGT
jgi:hypothetical protein